LKNAFTANQSNPSSSNAKYSQKDTEEMINKMKETNKKSQMMSAHRMDFSKPIQEDNIGEDASIQFDVECHNCHHEGYMRMCTCSIPYFKEIIIMAFTCENCLTRSTEVKVGGAMSDKATKYTITCNNIDDMDRDLFKSETAEIEIPEIGVTVVSGSLGGVYSTVEGLIEKMLSTLRDDNPFVGDSAQNDQKSSFTLFLEKLQDLKDGKIFPFQIIMDDPLSNCFVQNPFHPKEDPLV
jgi:zinc finger protein